MLELNIPGGPRLDLEHLVLDYNGTLALDGDIIPGVMGLLSEVKKEMSVHVLTADTHGTVRDKFPPETVHLHLLPARHQDQGKLEYVKNLGAGICACVGNGRNDALMLRKAALGVAVLSGEGCHSLALSGADISVPGILDALNLFLRPARLIATLRN
ncbi:MAG: HAD family hydrolase [Desulfonatronovibrionaceae bacterium]